MDNAFANIELAREIVTAELQRKESVIEFEKKDLAEKTAMLEKRIAGVETEKNMSSIQIERIES